MRKFQTFCFCFSIVVGFICPAYANEQVVILPKHAASLPIASGTPMQNEIACQVVNNSYPSSVAVSLASLTNKELIFIAKINGNPLIENKGYLTRKENNLIIQPLASGWKNPIQLVNLDHDIAIKIIQCEKNSS